jgi:hypothetical protein
MRRHLERFRTPITLLAAALVLLGGAFSARAQNVLMNSAETINPGNFKLAAFPTLLLGKHGADDQWGLAGRFGYGLTRNFDVEGKLAAFDGLTFYGADAELWLVRDRSGVNASFAVGVHRSDYDAANDVSGVDASVIFSGHLTPRVELYGGLQLGFESVQSSDTDFTRAHFVPGLEIRLTHQMDFLMEYGVALNDRTQSYFSVGLAAYFE